MPNPTDRTQRRWFWGALIVGALIVLATPAVTVGALYIDHVLSYAGVCGPHATDIAAYPCSEAQYRNEFGAGFAAFGVGLTAVGATALSALSVAVGWGLLAFVGNLRGPSQSVASS